MIRRCFNQHSFNRWRTRVTPARAAALRPQYPEGASGTACKAPSGEVSASPSRAPSSYVPRKPKIDPATIPSSMEMRAESWRRGR